MGAALQVRRAAAAAAADRGCAVTTGSVRNGNQTAAGCAAAAQALNADHDPENCHGGVNYAIWPPAQPAACYVCRAPGVAAKLSKNPAQVSFVGPLPPAPPPCPPPPPPAPIPHFHCSGNQVAVGETVILLHPPLHLAAVSIWIERERQQNDILADGYSLHALSRLGGRGAAFRAQLSSRCGAAADYPDYDPPDHLPCIPCASPT